MNLVVLKELHPSKMALRACSRVSKCTRYTSSDLSVSKKLSIGALSQPLPLRHIGYRDQSGANNWRYSMAMLSALRGKSTRI